MQLILGSMHFSLSQFKQAASCVLLKFISEAEELVMGHFVKLGKLKMVFFCIKHSGKVTYKCGIIHFTHKR